MTKTPTKYFDLFFEADAHFGTLTPTRINGLRNILNIADNIFYQTGPKYLGNPD